MKYFHICTISNDMEQYRRMKSSFLKAGFDERQCRYSLFDNVGKNNFDPYETFNLVQTTNEDSYIIFCHQDLVLDQDNGMEDLRARLGELDKIDPSWGICGNAGVNSTYEYVVRIEDRHHSPNWTGRFPQRVFSLDENFLVIKASSMIRCSANIRGFHFYGTDLCLQAIANGYSCYVIDFHLSHMGFGTFSQAFWETKSIFYENWCTKFSFSCVKTITGQWMCFSRNKLLREIGSTYLIIKLLLLVNRVSPFLNPTRERSIT